MSKRLEKIAKFLLVIAIGVVVGGLAGHAQESDVAPVIEHADNVTITCEQPNLSFGGVASSYCSEDNATTTYCNVEVYALDVENDMTLTGSAYFDSDVFFNDEKATTTESKHKYADIEIALTQTATSTGYLATTTAGEYCNRGAPLMVYPDGFLHIINANSAWSYGMRITTTSCEAYNSSNGKCAEFTATTSQKLMGYKLFTKDWEGLIALGGRSIFGATNTPGDYFGYLAIGSSTPFVLDNNECVLVTDNHFSATSSASFTTTGGYETFEGALYLRAHLQ